MKLSLLHLFIYIFPLVYAWADWQETGVTACGPVMIKLNTNPDSGTGTSYEIKINGTPDNACVVKLKSYFLTVSGKQVSGEVELTSAGQWQQQQELQPGDSVESFIRTQVLSLTGCSCAGESNSSSAGSSPKPETAAATVTPPADTSAADLWNEKPRTPEVAATKSTAPAGSGSVTAVATPAQVAAPADSAFGSKWGAEPHPSWQTAPDSVAKGVAASGLKNTETIENQMPVLQQPASGTATERAEEWTPSLSTKADSAAATVPIAAGPPAEWASRWSLASKNLWGIAGDSSALFSVLADSMLLTASDEAAEVNALTPEELDSIRIYNDPFILEGLYTIADAYVRIDATKATRNVAAPARHKLELLEEKQLIFMDKYTKLVKTGKYGLTVCSACGGSPIIFRSDSYPPFEPCSECKGGGYKLTYHGDAKPNTIEHLYFAELLPSPDYRRPTLKRISEGPTDFEYENGIFKTELEKLSDNHNPYFFACFYYKGDDDNSNRMVITEVINKKEHGGLFYGADKTGVLQLLSAYLPDTATLPDEVYLWEFNSFDDAYDRSIIPLHRAGVVGFDIDVVKYEIPDAAAGRERE